MITLLKESVDSNKVDLLITIPCTTRVNFGGGEKRNFKLDIRKEPDCDEAELNAWELETHDGSLIKFLMVYVDDVRLDSADDEEHVSVDVRATVTADTPMNDSDYEYISEALEDFIVNDISVEIYGSMYTYSEYVDYSSSDYRGERWRTEEVAELSALWRDYDAKIKYKVVH